MAMLYSIIGLSVLGIILSLAAFDPMALSIFLATLLSLWGVGGVAFWPHVKRTSRLTKLSITIGVILVLSVATTQWPLRLGFTASRTALELLANRVNADSMPHLPMQAGIFRVRAAGIKRSGTVYLWTDESESGPAGFVQGTAESLESELNVWFAMRLDHGWYFVMED